MDRNEAMDLLSKTEILFKKHDEFSCVSDINDPMKLFSNSQNAKADDTSKSFQLEFMHDMTMYTLSYSSGQLKLIDLAEGYEAQKATVVNSFPEIIKTLEKDDSEDGKNE